MEQIEGKKEGQERPGPIDIKATPLCLGGPRTEVIAEKVQKDGRRGIRSLPRASVPIIREKERTISIKIR